MKALTYMEHGKFALIHRCKLADFKNHDGIIRMNYRRNDNA